MHCVTTHLNFFCCCFSCCCYDCSGCCFCCCWSQKPYFKVFVVVFVCLLLLLLLILKRWFKVKVKIRFSNRWDIYQVYIWHIFGIFETYLRHILGINQISKYLLTNQIILVHSIFCNISLLFMDTEIFAAYAGSCLFF